MGDSELKQQRDVFRSLCVRMLADEITFESFDDECPDPPPGDPFLAQVYEDLVDCAEHLPTKSLFSREADYDSQVALAVYLDSLLLGYDRGSEELLIAREELRALTRKRSRRLIEHEVRKRLDTEEMGPG